MTWREEIIGDCRLILGDCRDVLPTLPRVDAVVTDPPYGARNKFGIQIKPDGVRRLQFDWDNYDINQTVYTAFECAISKCDAFFIFCGVSQISMLEEIACGSFTVKPAVWIKANPPPALPGNWWPSGFEHALYGYKPGAYFSSDDTVRRNVFYTDTYRNGIRAEEKVDHPTQKWLPLLITITEAISKQDSCILDQFMGSGTTGVACVKLGRKFIGIEIEPKYFDIACRRIDEAYKQGDLFREQPRTKPVQEALL